MSSTEPIFFRSFNKYLIAATKSDGSSVRLSSGEMCIRDRLRGEQLLEDVRRAVSFQRPHFHFSKSLSAELRLATERLLRNQ